MDIAQEIINKQVATKIIEDILNEEDDGEKRKLNATFFKEPIFYVQDNSIIEEALKTLKEIDRRNDESSFNIIKLKNDIISFNDTIENGLKTVIELVDEPMLYGALMVIDSSEYINILNPLVAFQVANMARTNRDKKVKFYLYEYIESNVLEENIKRVKKLIEDGKYDDSYDTKLLTDLTFCAKEAFKKAYEGVPQKIKISEKSFPTISTRAFVKSLKSTKFTTRRFEKEDLIYEDECSSKRLTRLGDAFLNNSEIYSQNILMTNIKKISIDIKNYIIVPHNVIHDGLKYPYYGFSTMKYIRNGSNLAGYHLSPFMSPNIGYTKSPWESTSVCTGSLSNTSIEGLKSIAHANLASPYHKQVIKTRINPLAYVEINKQMAKEIYQMEGIIDEK